MAYSITYGSKTHRKNKVQGINHSFLAAVCTAVLLLGVGFLWPQARELLRQVFVPMANEHTIEAMRQMVENICQGTSVSDSVLTFCQQVIGHAYPLS